MNSLNISEFREVRSKFLKENSNLNEMINASNPLLSSFKRDLVDGGAEHTFKTLKEQNNRALIGLFECPYHPNLLFEAANFDEILPTIKIPQCTNDVVKSIRLLGGTEGISSEDVVAIFPENFKNHRVKSENAIFYFADKFANRHLKYTKKFITEFSFSDYFKSLSSIKREELEFLATNWFYLHEYFHRTGSMPLPEYLYEKSNKYTASVEELRVDLLSIQYLCDKKDSASNLTKQFILAERLVGYPSFRDIDTNFDAFSSSIFMKELLDNKKFSGAIDDEILCEVVKSLLVKIENIEKTVLLVNNAKHRKVILVEKFKEMYESSHEATQLFKCKKVKNGK